MGTKPRLHLFIGGSPRSGTSALTSLVNANSYAAVGMERYAPIWNQETLTPRHFEADFFLTEHAFDAGRNMAMMFGRQGIEERFPTARVVGDKYPFLTEHLDFIFRAFPDARVLFILRNPLSVCESIQVRFDDAEDRFNLDAQAGLKRWNKALANVSQGIKDGMNISVVTYERAFLSRASAERIYDACDLSITDADQKRLDNIVAKAAALNLKEGPRNEAIRFLVSQRANFGLYRELTRNHCILRDLDG